MPQELLTAPDCPDELLHVWVWFCQLPLALSYLEIRSWAELTETAPTADEIDLLMQANNLYQRTLYG